MWKFGTLAVLLPLLLVSVHGDCRVPTYPPDRYIVIPISSTANMPPKLSWHKDEMVAQNLWRTTGGKQVPTESGIRKNILR